MEKMTMKTALDNLCANYGAYMSRNDYKELLRIGIDKGMSVRAAYIGAKMMLSEHTGQHEYFTIEDMEEVTGESRETIIERIEQLRDMYEAQGGNPDDLFPPIKQSYTYTVKL